MIEVFDKFTNARLFVTEDNSCMTAKEIDEINTSSHYFKLDGKRISPNELKLQLRIKSDHKPAVLHKEDESKPDQPKRKVRAIRCINNNKTYRTMSEAGKDLGLDSALISYSLKVNRPTKGYSFEFVD